MAYDHPVYTSRDFVPLAVSTAGSGAASGKFYSFTNMTLFGIGFENVVAGTSTYTSGGVVTSPATLATLLRVTNTSTTTVALSTSTLGTFVIGGTGTAAVGGFISYPIVTGTATNGGVAINPGDVIYCVNGTDTAATFVPILDMAVTPLANVTA